MSTKVFGGPKALAVAPPASIELATSSSTFDLEIDVRRVFEQSLAIQRVMAAVMKDGEHYGVIPGTEGKPDKDGKVKSKKSLWQPGADKLCMLFRLRPEYEDHITERRTFIGVVSRCRLVHIPTGENWGEGVGSANSREAKYLNQATGKVCPACNKVTIKKSRDKGGGWYCFAKIGGCGQQYGEKEKFDGDAMQVNGDKVWDLHNTILKMANKRAKVAAVLTATAASDCFTQDLLENLEEIRREDLGEDEQPPASNGSGVNGNGGNGNGNGNGNGSNGNGHQGSNGGNGSGPSASVNGNGKATPIQVRDPNMALRARGVTAEKTMDWVDGQLGRKSPALLDIPSTDIDMLIGIAKEPVKEQK